MGWQQFTGDGGTIISLEHYGASAPAGMLFTEFGFTVENVINTARKLLTK